jgi:iron(III) transport system ATP-binding protein
VAAGKTTLLRQLAGFNLPDSGRVLFNDEDVSNLPPHKRETAMMFQSYALWPHMTVEENVAFGLKERKVAKEEVKRRVAEALEMVQMEGLGKRKTNELSGGQQQRVALARSLVIRPRCLLLDEPLSNLDARLRLEMRSEIRRICKESGLTTVYVTHDQKEALSMADRMAIMNAGEVVQIGTPREIYRAPSSTLVADFIGETNFLPGKVVSRGEGGVRTVLTGWGTFVGQTTRPDFAAEPGDAVVLSIRPEAWVFSGQSHEQNCLQGNVSHAAYLGELSQYDIACEPELSLRVFEMNPRMIRSPGGGPVLVKVEAEDVVILPPPDQSSKP